MRVRPTPVALGGWLAVACVAAGMVGSGCNALSGIGDFEVVAEAGAEAAADVGQGEGSTQIDAAPREEAGEAAVDAPADAGHAADADAAAVNDGGRGDAPGEAAQGSDGASDAGADAPVDAGHDAGADAPVTCSATCDAGGCPVMHSNGLGQSYYDCTPLGTYNQAQATEACTAFTGNASLCTLDPIPCGGSNEHQICSNGASTCGCWRYSGLNTGQVNSNATCLCVPGTAPSWN